jgi:hypothetical protein
LVASTASKVGSSVPARADPGVVHQDVHAATGGFGEFGGGGGEFGRRPGVTQVGADEVGCAAVGADLRHDVLPALGVAAGDHDVAAVTGECEGRGAQFRSLSR